MSRNFRINPKFVLVSVLIALYLKIRMVEADLPNKDLMNVASCMREFFGENFIPSHYKNNEDALTDGEYLGMSCKMVSEDVLLAAAGSDDKGHAIIECLEKTNSQDLFRTYSELGQERAATDYVESIENDRIEPEGSETSAQTAPLQYSIYDVPALNFHKGVCNAEIKTVNFIQLEDEQDKSDALQCLKKCTSNFISRVKNVLIGVRDKAINKSSNEMDNKNTELVERLKNIPHSSFEFTKENFNSDLEHSSQFLNIDLMYQIGKRYLVIYNELYHNLDQYFIQEVDNPKSIMGYLDDKLYDRYSVYEDCTELECAMTLKNAPLYNLIETGASDDVSIVLRSFEYDQKDLRNWVESHTTDWQKFCKAFKGTKNSPAESSNS